MNERIIEVAENSHPMNNKELKNAYDDYVAQCNKDGKSHISWGSWALYNYPKKKQKDVVEV